MRINSKTPRGLGRGLAGAAGALVLTCTAALAQQEVKLGAFVTLSGISADRKSVV